MRYTDIGDFQLALFVELFTKTTISIPDVPLIKNTELSFDVTLDSVSMLKLLIIMMIIKLVTVTSVPIKTHVESMKESRIRKPLGKSSR